MALTGPQGAAGASAMVSLQSGSRAELRLGLRGWRMRPLHALLVQRAIEQGVRNMLVVASLAGSVGFNLAADTPHEGASPHEH